MQQFATFNTEGHPTGFYLWAGDLVPAGSVEISDEDYQAYIQEPGQWVRDPATGQRVAAPPLPPPTAEEVISGLVAALEAHYDATAHTHRYDNRLTCALRAGYAGPFQAEGTAFAIWMDTCNAYGYQVMAECLAGTRAIPTAAELIAEMPVIAWPVG